jgi:hypothetical protein
LLKAKIIDKNGKFNTDLEDKRIRQGEYGKEFVLVNNKDTATGQDIVITEADIDNLVRAKAAMYAGCRTLSKLVNVDCLDFEQVILAVVAPLVLSAGVQGVAVALAVPAHAANPQVMLETSKETIVIRLGYWTA